MSLCRLLFELFRLWYFLWYCRTRCILSSRILLHHNYIFTEKLRNNKKITETTTGEPHLKELRKMVHFDFQFTTVTFSKVHDLYSALRLQPIWITIRICACISWMHNSHRETDFFESLAEIREASLFIQKKAKKENSAIEKWTSDCALCPLNRKFMNVISIREKLESLNSPEE